MDDQSKLLEQAIQLTDEWLKQQGSGLLCLLCEHEEETPKEIFDLLWTVLDGDSPHG